ncbi:acyltransferase family protein [Flavobacterium sp. SM2513]|uniref:acyltransferase family protein n=1 Tax=Flavobacterium sp. SM2513 TaxID=3424766 RepID=UPI003D7F2547
MKTAHFPALTGIRILAAYMVYIHHFNPFQENDFGANVHYFFDSFHVGVTLFFVLSGFLIANRYYDTVDFSFKSYLQKRFARIYPMYFILTTLTFIIGYLSAKSYGGFGLYFLNISFLRGFFDDLKFSGIAQGWTLTVEEMFYFLAPLFFVLLKKSKSFLLILPIGFILLGVLLVQIFESHDLHGLMANINFMAGYTFFGRAFEFFVGIGLALVLKYNFTSNFKFFTLVGIIGIVISLYLLSILEMQPETTTSMVLKNTVNTVVLPLFGILPLYFGLIKEKTILSNVLRSDLFVLLGKSSYVFYLIHIGFIRNGLTTISSNYIFLFLSLNVIAVILFLFIEKPLNHYFRRNLN